MVAFAVETMASTGEALLTLNPQVNKLMGFCIRTRPIFLQSNNPTYYREQSGKISLLGTIDIVSELPRKKRPMVLDFGCGCRR